MEELFVFQMLNGTEEEIMRTNIQLGSGGFGNVWVGRSLKNGQRYAVKCINSENLQTKYQKKLIEREIDILGNQIKSENVIKLYG